MRRITNRFSFVTILIIALCYNYQIFANSSDGDDINSFSSQLQEERTIKGTVTDSDGDPVPGVTVVIKGTSQGTITDSEGKYELSETENAEVLVFSFVGLKTVETDISGRSIIDIVLEEDFIGLEEVVAIGYGSMKKKDLTGSVSTIGTEDVRSLAVASIGDVMQGKAAGVHVIASGTPGNDPTFHSRR